MPDASLLLTVFAVDKATAVLGKVGGTIDKVALGVAAGAALIAVKTTKMAADFQTNMLRVQTGAGELKSNMALVSDGVLNLATKTGDTTGELAKALYTVESGGQHGANGLLVLKAAAQGAKAEGADLNVVADATTSVLQDYHLTAQSAALVTSQLVAATGQGKTTFEQLAGSLSAVLPIASVAKIKFTDVVGAIASMTVHGMSAEQASQNLSDAIRHMQAPTIAQTKYMQQLGINSADVTDKLGERGITGTMQYLSQTILSKMGPAGHVLLGTFNQSAQAAANVKAMVASMPAPLAALAKSFQDNKITSKDWTAALKALSPEQANQMRQFATLQNRSTGFSDAIKSGTPAATTYAAALRGVTGDATGLNVALMLTGENTAYTNNAVKAISSTATEAGNNVKGWSEIQGTFNVRMAQAKEQIEVLGIRIGNALLPYMTKLVTVMGTSVGWLTKHKTVAKDLAVVIGILAGAVLLYKTYTIAANVVDKVSIVLKGAAKVANLLYVGSMYLVRGAIMAWTAAQWLLNVALDASPIGLVVLGIAALVTAVVLIATKTTWFQTAWHATWDLMKTIGSFFMGWGKYLLPILGPIGLIGLGAIELYQHWDTVWGFMKVIGRWFAGPFVDFFTQTIPAGFRAFERGIDAYLVAPFLSGASMIIHGAADAFGWVPGLGGKLKTAAKEFDSFRDSVNASLNGIHNYSKTVTVSVTGNGAALVANGRITGHLASGGTVRQAGRYLTGENGPEVVDLPTGASVYPNGVSPGPLPRGGGGTTTICLHITGTAKAAVQQVQAYVRDNFSGDVVLALQGHA